MSLNDHSSDLKKQIAFRNAFKYYINLDINLNVPHLARILE